MTGHSETRIERFRVAPSRHSRRARLGRRPEVGWIDASAPGGVHEALMATGQIEHPYVNDHELGIRWIEKKDWWFESTFGAAPARPGERLTLCFDGLDTVVDLWLNGRRLGHHSTMHAPAVFDVTELVRDENVLQLRFAPPLAGRLIPRSAIALAAKGRRRLQEFTGSEVSDPDRGRNLAMASTIRKATFSWGWDFGPRVPSIGIWQPVRLVRDRVAALGGHHFTTTAVDVDRGTADVALEIEIDHVEPADVNVRATLTSPTGTTTDLAPTRTSGGTFRATAHLVDAHLWWTHDLGDPALHELTIELLHGDEVLDRRSSAVGVRTIAIDRSPDPAGGHHFRFLLNGVPLFARGAAWLPPTLLVGSTDDDVIRRLVAQARHGAMNMIRVWGGGVYGPDALYEACDREGILIWQDFAFACIDYPSNRRALRREVAAEARHQVRRLRSHPSLALWCGNNEVHMIHGLAWESYRPGNWGWTFFHESLPAAVAELDGSVPYWPGSPWGEAPEEGWRAINGVLDGDRHAWEVWHGHDLGAGGGPFDSVGESRHFRRYARDTGKFISEFGIQASPALSTLARWTPGQTLEIHSDAFDHRMKDYPKDKHDAVMQIETGLASTMREYVDFSMTSQAEGLKFGIEHYRHRAPHTSGTLVWQLNDVWPGFSWSLIDFEGVPKAGFYASRRAFATVLASFHEGPDGRLGLWVSNAGRTPASTDLQVEILALGGTPIVAESTSVTVEPNDSALAWEMPDDVAVDPARHVAWVSGSEIVSNRYFFGPVKDLRLPATRLEVRRERTGPGSGLIRIRASDFATFVHLEAADHAFTVDDSYVDLRPGDEQVLTVSGLDPDLSLSALVVRGYAGQHVEVIER